MVAPLVLETDNAIQCKPESFGAEKADNGTQHHDNVLSRVMS